MPMNLMDRVRARLGREEGFSLVEMVVALLVLGIAMGGLAHLTASSLVTSSRNRQREVAVGLTNQLMEEIRANGYDNIKMQSGPATYVDNGVSKPTLMDGSCTTCLVHQRTVVSGRYTFTVSTWVYGVDDAADGLAGSDADLLTVDYKRVILEVAATAGASFRYKVDTIIHDTESEPVVAVQGIRLELRDPANGNQIIGSTDYVWELTISGAGIDAAEVDEGVYENFTLPAGAYTCLLKNTPSSSGWHPVGTTNAEETFGCTVLDGAITTTARYWTQDQTCSYTPGLTGRLWVRVLTPDGTPLAGAMVDAAPAAGQPTNPPATSTDANGDVTFNPVDTGDYTVSVTATGYDPSPPLTTCITTTVPTQPQLTFTLNPTPPPQQTATVNVIVKSKKDGVRTIKAVLEDGPQLYEQQQDFNKDQTKTFTFTPVFGTYNVRVYCLKNGKWNKKKEDKKETFNRTTPPYNYGEWKIGC